MVWQDGFIDLITKDSYLTIDNRYGRTVLQRTAKTGAKKHVNWRQGDAREKLGDLDSEVLPIAERFNDSLAIWQSGLDEGIREDFWERLNIRGEIESIVELMRVIEPFICRVGLIRDGHTRLQLY